MWDYAYSHDAAATPAQLWAYYGNPARWPEFDPGLASVSVDGPFVPGTHGTFTPRPGDPRGTDPIPFTLTFAEPDQGFTARSALPDTTTFQFTHMLTALTPTHTRITHGITLTGPSADTLLPTLRPQLMELLPTIVIRLANLASGGGEID